jgi:two-component system alkaline phosphatase synthesis response regulator PhoP
MTRRVVLLADLDPEWTTIVRALEAAPMEVDVLAPRTPAADVVACAARAEAVVVVDLAPDPSRGMAIVGACRRSAGVGPVVAVAANPSAELTRAVRLAGAFYLALQPVTAEEMRSILQNAFQSLDRRRTSASMCRAVRRILIIDDDQDFVASTTALLEAYGYAVSTAATGRDGLYKARTEQPDLIVLDVMMENDSAGYEVNEAVKFAPGYESIRHIPILMVSSIQVDPATRFSMADEAPMITPNTYLTKPLDIPRFLAEVSALLGEAPQPSPAGAAR